MLQHIEPFYGWLHLYNHEEDEASPFHEVEHNLFYYDRHIYEFCAHPLWDSIESESLLVKILYVNYDNGYAIIELMGEWNDLQYNDFRLLIENCLQGLLYNGVHKFVLICENVFNVYLGSDDYYEAFYEEIAEEGGWICLYKMRPQVLTEFQQYNLGQYVFWSHEAENNLLWRKMKPWHLYDLIDTRFHKVLM